MMLEATLPDGLRSRVHRDGMLAYDFGDAWNSGDATPGGGIAAHARRIQVINAHLACVKASLTTGFSIAPATGETVIGVAYELNDELAKLGGVTAAIGESGMLMMALARARVEAPHGPFDWRFQRVGPAIAVDEIDRSYALLREMLESPRRADALLYAELLLRAQAAISVDDPAGALVYAWTAAEGMLRSLFSRWVDECGKQEVGPDEQGHERVFLDANRRKSLEGGSITGWHMAEIGSLVGWLPFDLYRTVRNCAKARNDWLHKQDLRALEHAPEAIHATQQLFSLTEGIDLTPGEVGSISISQRLPSKSNDE